MRRLGFVLVCACIAWPGAGRSDPRATVVGVAGGKAGADGEVALVGSLGEIYLRDGGVWRRQGGGVAATLSRAWGSKATEVIAVGARQPVYGHDGKSWFALPGSNGMSGPALLSEPGSTVPAVAVGKRIFLLDLGARKLVPTTLSAPGLPTALFAQSARDVSVIVDGKLQRNAGAGGWKNVAGADENLVALGPHLALGIDGGVYATDASRLRKLAVDPALAAFRPRLVAAAAAGGRRVVLVGALGDGYAAAAIDGARVVLLGKLPGVARADEPVGAILVDDGAVVVATRSGLVLGGDGQTWKTEAIATAVSETKHPSEPPAPIPTTRP